MKPENKASPVQPKRVTCPTCGGDSVYAATNEFRPFCSARCKNIDLGAWASENFSMPTDGLSEDQITDAEPHSSASH